MKFKYEYVEFVEVKKAFKAHKRDDDYEITETINIPVGLKGDVVSMGFNSSDDLPAYYDIEFNVEGRDVEVSVGENEIEVYFKINH